MIKAVVGANWGDEGKGKITDMLAKEADIIVRFQGGANAGHTIVNNYGKFALHTLPSGVFYSHTTSVIGNGVALNIPVLIKELNEIVSKGVPAPKIKISDRAQMVMPYHILFDQYEEERLGGKSFGSTKSGIAPFYSDKYAKIGFQVNELFDGIGAALVFNFKRLKREEFDGLKPKIDWSMVESFPFPASFEEQQYIGDEGKIHVYSWDGQQETTLVGPYSVRELYLDHFGKS